MAKSRDKEQKKLQSRRGMISRRETTGEATELEVCLKKAKELN